MTTDPSVAETSLPCSVCGDPAGPEARSDCYRCGEYFHLRLTTTATGPDCGDVWIDDEVMALQFACRNCLMEQAGDLPGEEPPERPKARRAASGESARDLARRRR